MIERILARIFAVLLDQYVPGITVFYSAIFFLWFINRLLRGTVFLSRLDLLVFLYFVASMVVSFASGASVSNIVSYFNKLFLCLVILKVFASDPLRFDHRWCERAFRLGIYALCVFVFWSLLRPGAYVTQWGVNTFVMSFTSQHLAASFIVLLMSSLFLIVGIKGKGLKSLDFLIMTALMYPLMMTGARTIAICGLVFYVLAALALTGRLKGVRRATASAAFLVVASGLFLHGMASFSIIEKNETLGGSSLSNGRDAIWEYYAGAFLQSTPGEMLFGRGVGFFANESALKVGTHNDVLYFLIAFGVVGLALYLGFLLVSLLAYGRRVGNFVVLAVVLFASVVNGYSGYTDLVTATVLVLACITTYCEEPSQRRCGTTTRRERGLRVGWRPHGRSGLVERRCARASLGVWL